ncbi:MAG: cyclic nucleotide-binding domain-containing protein [Pseudomonadota bacterium]
MTAVTTHLELKDKTAALAATDIFTSLKDASLERIAQMCEWRSYAAGVPLFAAGQYDAREVFFILEGELVVYVPRGGHGEMQMTPYKKGATFGAPFALAENSDAAGRITVTARSEAFVAMVHVDAFRSILTRHPSAAVALLDKFAEDLFIDGGLGDRGKALDPEARIYAELVGLAAPDVSAHGGWRIQEMPKHRQLADCAGVTENGAAAAVAKLIREGVARRDYPGLEILDYDKFRAFAGS